MSTSDKRLISCKNCKHIKKAPFRYIDGNTVYDCKYAQGWVNPYGTCENVQESLISKIKRIFSGYFYPEI